MIPEILGEGGGGGKEPLLDQKRVKVYVVSG